MKTEYDDLTKSVTVRDLMDASKLGIYNPSLDPTIFGFKSVLRQLIKLRKETPQHLTFVKLFRQVKVTCEGKLPLPPLE